VILANPGGQPKRLLAASLLVLCAACVRDTRDLQAARSQAELRPSGLIAQSWGVCSLIGPRDDNPGIFGTDLGFSARRAQDSQLTLLFGDTWLKSGDACRAPAARSDDFAAYLPAQLPAQLATAPPPADPNQRCALLEYPLQNPADPTSWPRLRLFPNPIAHSEDAIMDTSALRTPVAAFSDGQRLFALFSRGDPAYCAQSSECPAETQCTTDPGYGGPRLGECELPIKLAQDAAPAWCRRDDDCPAAVSCKPGRGVCLSERPFRLRTAQTEVVPTWYHDDPRRGVVQTLYVTAAVWPERPSDYAVLARFPTNRFQNVAAHSVARFDPAHPEKNDYRPGYDALLVWGRSSFVEHGGAQALPFFFYVPLSELRQDPLVWRPRFFAGYAPNGAPRFSEREADAQPVYGAEADLTQTPNGPKLAWREPEFDYVAQMSVGYVAPLGRFVMLYGGDLPAFMVLDPATAKAREPTHLQVSPGAIHMRSAPHPWGRARASAREPGWSSAEPLLTRAGAARFLACGKGGKAGLPGCIEDGDPSSTLQAVAAAVSGKADAASCMGGELAYGVQSMLSGDPIGRLYAPNLLDEWTQDLTPPVGAPARTRSAEIYWNVSTWNPYRVMLIKSRIAQR